MTRAAERAVGRFIEAVNRRASSEIAALITEDHTFVDSGGSSQSGREAVAAAWEQFFRMFPDYCMHVEWTLVRGNLVALFGSASCTFSGRRGPVAEDRIEMPAAWRAVVKRGKVSLWQVYADWTEGSRVIKQVQVVR